MLTIVVTSLVLMRARGLSEVLSPSSDVLKEWELRGVVFLSLVLQVILIYLGNRRKYVPHNWIKVVTWLAYILADSVAVYALGMISNMIREIKNGKLVSKMNLHAELSTFWAPFLLLHLGGPDTISAYAIEDNELWLRHLLTLVNQTGLTVYVLVMAWTHPILLFLAILILLSGFYKYGERVWVLRAASNEHFKRSLAEYQPQRKYFNKIVEECELRGAEGYNIMPHHVIEVRDPEALDDAIADLSSQKLSSRKDDILSSSRKEDTGKKAEDTKKKAEDQVYKDDVPELLVACSLVNNSKCLFADHLFNLESKLLDLSRISKGKCDLRQGKHHVEIFKVIEIELSLIYNMLYTKAKAVHTSWGFICRLAILFSICVSLVVFSLQDKRRYLKVDLCLTFLLLGSAIFLELYALSYILFSDQFALWLIKNKQSTVLKFVNRIQPPSKRRRWSNSFGQYSLMRCSKENNSCWWRFLKLLQVDEMGVKFLHHGCGDVTGEIKKVILSKISRKEVKDEQGLPFLWIDKGGEVMKEKKLLGQLKWSIDLEFDMSILVWHVATELCYYPDDYNPARKDINNSSFKKIQELSLNSLHLSRYMLYLLVMYPSMLPVGIGSISFGDIYKETKKYFAKRKPNQEKCHSECNCKALGIECNPKIREACVVLRSQVKNEFNLSVTKEDKVKYLLFNGCRLALELETISPEERKWDVIRKVWGEMLIYAASKSKAIDHAKHMQWGGELITHVWFLMAHYGLTDNFMIPRAPAITEIMVNSW